MLIQSNTRGVSRVRARERFGLQNKWLHPNRLLEVISGPFERLYSPGNRLEEYSVARAKSVFERVTIQTVHFL